MRKFLGFLLIFGIIVGTYFGIKFEINYYNDKYGLNAEEKPIEEPIKNESLEDIADALTVPTLYNNVMPHSVTSYFYGINVFDVSTLSNEMKLLMVFNNLYDKEYDKLDDGTVKLKGNDVKEYYEKIFSDEYHPISVSQSILFTTLDSTYNGVCYRNYNYDETTDIYVITLAQCGGNIGPAEWNPYIKRYNVEKDENNLYLDYYVASYIKVDDEENDPNPITIYNKIFDEKIYSGNDLNEINNLITENKISKYRLTYKKESNGKYYLVSGNWI